MLLFDIVALIKLKHNRYLQIPQEKNAAGFVAFQMTDSIKTVPVLYNWEPWYCSLIASIRDFVEGSCIISSICLRNSVLVIDNKTFNPVRNCEKNNSAFLFYWGGKTNNNLPLLHSSWMQGPLPCLPFVFGTRDSSSFLQLASWRLGLP